jgi:alkanesulfonate monooxygenase SsuD/methylene tetrahydromethanopterin reductase-like flavin-dependent oxidoreductase (luciferase family)
LRNSATIGEELAVRRSVFWLLDHYPETGESLASLPATALAHARLADRLGFDGLWLAEHHFQTLGTVPNPAVLLAAMAQRTEKLRLGPAVAVLPLRNPIHIAEDYALVDVLSGGRLNRGVGTGSQLLEFGGLGLDFERRRDLFEANLAVLRERWSAAASGERGRSGLNVAPVQTPAPPIYVATMQESGAHRVGVQGDSMLTLVSPLTPDVGEVACRVRAHTRGLEEAGHPEGSAEAVVAVFAHVAESEAEGEDIGAPALGRFIQAMLGAAPPNPLDLYLQMRERGTGLFGSAEHVAKQIDRYADVGVGHLAFISRFGGIPVEAAEQNLRRLAPPASQ